MPFSAIRSQGASQASGATRIAKSMLFSKRAAWAWIKQQVGDGVDMVINLAAGLDARPYRMSLRKGSEEMTRLRHALVLLAERVFAARAKPA